MEIRLVKYTNDWEERWDCFVMHNSANGTFLQTRKFINYHPSDRFDDASLLMLHGSNIVAVIPACNIVENGRKCFFSHKGSTFGGIVIDKRKYSITTLEELFTALDLYYKAQAYDRVYMKSTSSVFSKQSPELLDYYYYKYDYISINELSFYIDCSMLDEDILTRWTSGRRRDYKYSLKNDLLFRRLKTDEELIKFYSILCDNLARHGASPVHSLGELKDLKEERIADLVDFYGVFYMGELIAGTMLFYFEHNVLHTQYLAQDTSYKNLFTMNFLIYNLIKLAKDNGYKKFSFGISTEEQGKVLNMGLAVFKEGFGSDFCLNRSYMKILG